MKIKRLHACTGHRASLYALVPGQDDRHFITAGGDGWVVEWNLDNPENGQLIANTETQLFSLCALTEKSRLVAGNMHGGLHWLVRDRPDKTRNVQHHKRGVYDILELGDYLFTVGGDGVLTRWDIATGRTVESIQLSSQALRAIAYADQVGELVVGSSDHNIYWLDAQTLALKHVVRGAHENSVFSLACSPNGQRLLSGGRDALLKVWMVDTKEIAPQSPEQAAHLFTLNHIAFSPDGHLFATASRDKTFKIWDAQTYELLKVVDTLRLGGHINSVNRLLWHGGGLISVSDDRRAMIWSHEP
jgi:WD40 repeat protein